jgi:hypothetical protein
MVALFWVTMKPFEALAAASHPSYPTFQLRQSTRIDEASG